MTRFGLIFTTALAAMGVGYPGLTPMPIKLIWNASASAPIGFYSIDFEGPFEVTDLVAVDAPEPLATFLAERGCPDFVVDGGLAGLVKAWEKFAAGLANGYELENVHGFDMFPQTHHVEVVATLRRVDELTA